MILLYHKGGPKPCGQVSHVQLTSRKLQWDDFPAENVRILLRDETGIVHQRDVSQGDYVMCGACRRSIIPEWLRAD